MQQSIAQLKDTDGLDAISWWPLALGWWIAIALLVSLIIVLLLVFQRRRKFLRSWQNGILSQLTILENTVTQENSLSVATQLSELMRRIATFQYSREECAGLEGKEWLNWLKEHDPKAFDWEEKAGWLADAAYAPSDDQLPTEEIIDVIKAIRRWVK